MARQITGLLIDMDDRQVETTSEIGGYYGLELPDYGDPFPGMQKFQSARAALRATLESAGIRRIMLPAYICGCVPETLSDIGIAGETYHLDDSLYPQIQEDSIPDGCAILYVNYFGLSQGNVDRLLSEIPVNRVIIDNSQALFASAGPAMANVYSVRKFLGVPDGGLLKANGVEIRIPEKEDTQSIERMKHLLLRTAYSARAGYSAFLESEKTLKNTIPLRMSQLTKRLIASVDLDQVKKQRRENFFVLASALDKYNTIRWATDAESVPLCYPLVLDRDCSRLRQDLAERDIFIPTYWPDAITASAQHSIEHRLKNHCLAVPCDQRYSRQAILHLARTLISSIQSTT